MREREHGHGPARLALVELAARSAAPRPELTPPIEDAVKASPNTAAARAAVMDHFMVGKEIAKALSAAQSAVAGQDEVARLLKTLGG